MIGSMSSRESLKKNKDLTRRIIVENLSFLDDQSESMNNLSQRQFDYIERRTIYKPMIDKMIKEEFMKRDQKQKEYIKVIEEKTERRIINQKQELIKKLTQKIEVQQKTLLQQQTIISQQQKSIQKEQKVMIDLKKTIITFEQQKKQLLKKMQLLVQLQRKEKSQMLCQKDKLIQQIILLKESSCKIVSNHQKYLPKEFKFLQRQIQSFNQLTIFESKLVYQSDHINQTILNYLSDEEGQSFPMVIIFYAKNRTVFGIFSQGVTMQNQQKQKHKAFLFNATKGKVFDANQTAQSNIRPLSFIDSCLIVGNRELILKNHVMKTIRAYSGYIIGQSYFKLFYREQLTGERGENIQLEGVQIHRLWMKKSIQ